jgi:putative nucleotidyltransferase with HDIG domain
LWYHSLACASATRTLTSLTNPALEEEAFICGLLHDIGIIGMSQAFPKETARVVELMKETGLTQSEAEIRSFGFTHQEAGALLAEQWNFPETYHRAIRFHHNPYVESVDHEQPDSLLIYAVYAGNQIVKTMSFGRSFDMHMTGVDLRTWKILGTTPKMIIDLKSQIKRGFDGTLASWGMA